MQKVSERSSEEEQFIIRDQADLLMGDHLTAEQKVVNLTLYMRRQELSYLLANYEIFNLIQNVKGSIFYFGVYHGAGFMTWANLSAALEPFNHTREIVGFDTFAGYPSIGEEDRSGREYGTLVEGGFASASEHLLSGLFDVYDRNRPLGHIPKLSLVKGDVCETLPAYLEARQHVVISAIVLTMNLYEPTRVALLNCLPRMPVGAAIVVHSLNEEYYPGVSRAIRECLPYQRVLTLPYAPNLACIIKDL